MFKSLAAVSFAVIPSVSALALKTGCYSVNDRDGNCQFVMCLQSPKSTKNDAIKVYVAIVEKNYNVSACTETISVDVPSQRTLELNLPPKFSFGNKVTFIGGDVGKIRIIKDSRQSIDWRYVPVSDQYNTALVLKYPNSVFTSEACRRALSSK